jgi:hypothetical protein
VNENPHNDEPATKKPDDGKFHLDTAENPDAQNLPDSLDDS